MNVGDTIGVDALSTSSLDSPSIHIFPDIEFWGVLDSLIPPHKFPVPFSRRWAV